MDKNDWQTLIVAQLLVHIPVLYLSEIKRVSVLSKKKNQKSIGLLVGGIVLNRWMWLFFSVVEGIGAFFFLRDSAGNTHAVSPIWSMATALLIIWQLLVVLWMEVLLQMVSLKWAAASSLISALAAWVEVVFAWQGAAEIWAAVFMLPMAAWQVGICGVLFYIFKKDEKFHLPPPNQKTEANTPYDEKFSHDDRKHEPVHPQPAPSMWAPSSGIANGYAKTHHPVHASAQSEPQVHHTPIPSKQQMRRSAARERAHHSVPPAGFAYRSPGKQRSADNDADFGITVHSQGGQVSSDDEYPDEFDEDKINIEVY